MCSLNIRGLYVSHTMTSGVVSRCRERLISPRSFPAWFYIGVVSRCPVTLLALDYPPDLQYCSHVRESYDVGHSCPTHDGTACDIDTMITIFESNSYHL